MTLPWMAAKILLRPVAELRPHAGNARVHSAEQLEQIKASMLAFGFTNPLLVDEAGVLIAGHGRLEAASALGIAKVPVIVLRHLSAAQKEALRLADNRIAENATWDQALLRDALAAVPLSYATLWGGSRKPISARWPAPRARCTSLSFVASPHSRRCSPQRQRSPIRVRGQASYFKYKKQL
jgi:hypothetical protein